MALAAITFDLWETLILDRRELALKRADLRVAGTVKELARVGERFSEDRIWEAYKQCSDICKNIQFEQRDIDFMGQVRVFVECIDRQLPERLDTRTINDIAVNYSDSFYIHPPFLHPSAFSVLEFLATNNYDLCLISNTGMTPGYALRIYMDRLGILGFFKHLMFSDEVLMAKPSKEMFLQAVAVLRVRPDMIVHVGDDLHNDIIGAKDAGLRTVWISPDNAFNEMVDLTADFIVSDLSELPGIIKEF